MKRKHKEFIKKLAELSFDATECSLQYVRYILENLQKEYPRLARQVLRYYLICIQKIYKSKQVNVEYVGGWPDGSSDALLDKLNLDRVLDVVTRENPRLIGGVRVAHKDWVWDASLLGQLNYLMQQLRKL